MKIEKIKPIPKYILARIQKKMQKDYHYGKTAYYAYLTKNDGELVKVTVAVRLSKKFVYKQCAVHGIYSEKCFVKDMAFSYLGGLPSRLVCRRRYQNAKMVRRRRMGLCG